jgi:signal transduction histidine kinase
MPPTEPGAARRWMPGISQSLRIIAALVMVLIIDVTVQQLIELKARLLDDARSQMARLDIVFAEQTGRAVETVDLILREAMANTRAHEEARNATADSIDAMLRRRIVGVRQVEELLFAEPSGRIRYSSRGHEALPALPAAGRTLMAFEADHPDDGLEISEPIRAADGHWTTLLVHPLTDAGGAFAGVAAAVLNLSYFEDFYRAVQLDENGAIILHRRDGTVLARFPHDDAAIGTSYGELTPFRDILAHDIAGTVLMGSPIDGSRRVVAIRALRRYPLAVNVSVSEDRVLDVWHHETIIFLLATLVVCAVIGTLLLLLARESTQVEGLVAEFKSARDAAEAANAQLRVEMEERERAEAALRQAQRIEAVGQLTGGVAHDFNNLLTVLLGNIDLLQQTQGLDPAISERLNRMRVAAERGSTLTNHLLAFARRQSLSPRTVQLNSVVRGMADLLQSAVGSNVVIETSLAEAPWPALVDPTQIELVILNLALNARDAMPTGGTLTLETGNAVRGLPARPEAPPAGEYAMVCVRDTGTGMTPEVVERAFEPFFTTKGPGLGSGFGLSQVYGVAKQSNGGVEIESAPGRGNSRARLPAARHRRRGRGRATRNPASRHHGHRHHPAC